MLTLCALRQGHGTCIRAGGPTFAVLITSISYQSYCANYTRVGIVVVPGRTDVQSPPTLNDNCLGIHQKFPHDGLYVVPPLRSGLPLDGRVWLELWVASHQCGNCLFHGFCAKRERCNRWNRCWNPLLEPLSALEPFVGTPAGTPPSAGTPLQGTLPTDPSSAGTPSSTLSSTAFQHNPRPLVLPFPVIETPPQGTGIGSVKRRGQQFAMTTLYSVFMCCTPWHHPFTSIQNQRDYNNVSKLSMNACI